MYCVYFVKERGGSNLIKIGKTGECPYLRLDQLRRTKNKRNPHSCYELLGVCTTPFEEIEEGDTDKKGIQSKFEGLRAEGDWFRPGRELLEYIQKCARPHICERSCPSGTSNYEEWLAEQEAASKAMQKAFNECPKES
jgi:ferredoxin